MTTENTITIDASRFTSRDKAYDILAEALCLPEYFGRNLDALYDCLCEMPKGTKVHITGVETARRHIGDYIDAIVGTFADSSRIELEADE